MTGNRHPWAGSDIVGFIAGQDPMMKIVRVAATLDLPDCWVGAGFVRNAIWDALHGRPWHPSYSDVDVIYHDPGNLRAERDKQIEADLATRLPSVPWSVKNQARMHIRNGDPPYVDTTDALRHWSETCTAVAVRIVAEEIELLAPFGVSDLTMLIIAPTPAYEQKLAAWRARIVAKAWLRRWPRLRLVVSAH